jgi:quinol monooxygenase YgiN
MVVTIQALPGHELTVENALLGVVADTQAEAGCLQYDLHRDPDHAGRFVFYETWVSRDHWVAHDEAEHIVALQGVLDGRTEDVAILWLEKMEP